jgi:hypothetical protein
LSIPAELVTPERKRALLFTRARCLLSEGNNAAALLAYESEAILPANDYLKRRSLVDSACLGLAHLGLDHNKQASSYASFIAQQLTSIRINQQLFFAIDSSARIAEALSLSEVSSALHSIVRKHAPLERQYIPPSFAYLKALVAA